MQVEMTGEAHTVLLPRHQTSEQNLLSGLFYDDRGGNPAGGICGRDVDALASAALLRADARAGNFKPLFVLGLAPTYREIFEHMKQG